ncbi:MAG: SRPBCC family protein [Pseudomonadota bacterium]
MLKTILIVLAAIVAMLAGYAATRPDHFRVERSIVIQSPPATIFPLIDTLRYWQDWSPWVRKDPAMERTLSGPESGTGAVYAWKGNSDVGEGRMEIIESVPHARIRLRLDFVRPFEARNTAEFILSPVGQGTRVTWSLSGPSPFQSRLIGLFVDTEEMIGKDFEAGLDALKLQAEPKG